MADKARKELCMCLLEEHTAEQFRELLREHPSYAQLRYLGDGVRCLHSFLFFIASEYVKLTYKPIWAVL